MIELPRYAITDQKNIDMVASRIQYCQKVLDTVLVSRKYDDEANPKQALSYSIRELTVVHQHLSHEQRVASLKNKLVLIDNHLLDLVRGTFNILYLMLNGIEYHEFQVQEFNNGDAFKNYLLGQWIVETCNATGITSNAYFNQEEISPALIDSHLDMDFSTITKMDQIGWCEFVWRTNYQIIGGPFKSTQAETYLNTKAPAFLRQIIELHRSILRLSHIRKVLATVMRGAHDSEEAGLFSGEEGKLLFHGFTDTLVHAIEHHQGALEQFWQEFYTNTYAPLAASQYKDCRDKTYRDVVAAERFYSANSQTGRDVKTAIASLVRHVDPGAQQTQGEFESNTEAQQHFAKKLHAYLSHVPNYNQAKLAALCAASVPMSERTAAAEEDAAHADKARELASVTLCEYGGYSPEDIPEQLFDDVFQHLMSTPDTPETELESRKVKYDAAIITAKTHKLTQNETATSLNKTVLDYLEVDKTRLEHLDYHWFWGLSYSKTPKSVNLGLQAAELLNDEAKLAALIERQKQLYLGHNAAVRFLYWLFNINNYTYQSYLLAAYKGYQNHLYSSLANDSKTVLDDILGWGNLTSALEYFGRRISRYLTAVVTAGAAKKDSENGSANALSKLHDVTLAATAKPGGHTDIENTATPAALSNSSRASTFGLFTPSSARIESQDDLSAVEPGARYY